MKKRNTNAKEIVFTILLFPVVLLFLFVFLIITPFDYFKYKRTRYYKDTHEKYSWLCTSSYYIKLYDLIQNEKLPIEYYRCNYAPVTGYDYFIYKDALILNDYEPYFDTEKNIWTVEIEDEYVDIKDDVLGAIERCNAFLKDRICKKAIVLIDWNVYNEHSDIKYELFDFLPVYDDNIAVALKSIID